MAEMLRGNMIGDMEARFAQAMAEADPEELRARFGEEVRVRQVLLRTTCHAWRRCTGHAGRCAPGSSQA
jgi:hypothetical protein